MNATTPELTVVLDLELPEGEIRTEELDLLEVHFADLLRQVLIDTATEGD